MGCQVGISTASGVNKTPVAIIDPGLQLVACSWQLVASLRLVSLEDVEYFRVVHHLKICCYEVFVH